MGKNALTRRTFLVTTGASLVFAAGCTVPQPPSPPPTPSSSSSSAPPPDEATSLERFIALSSLVTGFAVSDLDPSLARLYLASLERWYEGKVDLSDLCTEVGLGDPKLTDTQRQRLVKSLMKRSEHREVLEGVLRYWYSGVYDTADGKACAAFGDALGWRSVRWTFAPGQCHSFGSWSTPPVTPS